MLWFIGSFPIIRFIPSNSYMAGAANREVSLYVITYENPYVVHAGERGPLS